jgi:hypothetical protein
VYLQVRYEISFVVLFTKKNINKTYEKS